MVNVFDAFQERLWPWIFVAWLIALISTLGALFIGEVMGQTPCLLCWYQRIFMFPLAVILAVASCGQTDSNVWRYALPLAVVGWFVAGYHNLIYFDIVSTAIKPCGAGPSCGGEGMVIWGIVPIPLLSLGAFSIIALLLFVVQKRNFNE